MKRARLGVPAAVFFALSIAVSAQQAATQSEQPPRLQPGSKTGNPTPGTPQPEPPRLANRITLIGCVQMAADAKAAVGASDANNPSDARFVLARAERKNIVPPDTGRSSVAASVASKTYRLHAIDSQLSPFVGARVEVSGEVLVPAVASLTDGNRATPVVHVGFVQKLSSTCS